MTMRSRKALLNMISSLILEFVTIISGFIVPRLIIQTYGSGVNGLIASISEFLGYIVLLQTGMGGVIKASLYKPLAHKNLSELSSIVKATEEFFKKVSYMTIAYIIILMIIIPQFIVKDFDFGYTAALILIIGISQVAQYYFGITNQMLLSADQNMYVYSIIQIVGVSINIIIIVVMIRLGCNIHLVKLGSAMVFVARPILLNIYARKKYSIDRRCKPNNKALSQRWDGLGHTIAYFVHNKTDIFLLTVIRGIEEVSIYSIYRMIAGGLNILISVVVKSVQAAFGNMIAKEENMVLEKNFRAFECLIHILTTILYSSAVVLLIPFITLYTKGFDINYIKPAFGYLLLAAEGVFCLRYSYSTIILAAGHYKQTKQGAFIEAGLNIIISLMLIRPFGLVGVAIGTLVSMAYRNVDYAIYYKKHIISVSTFEIVKRALVTIASIIGIFLMTPDMFFISISTYQEWIIYAIIVTLTSTCLTLIINYFFYSKELRYIFSIAKRLFFKSNKSVTI